MQLTNLQRNKNKKKPLNDSGRQKFESISSGSRESTQSQLI